MSEIRTPPEIVGVGLSGGADSALAACVLRDQGLDVRAYTFRVWQDPQCTRCARAFPEDAALVARKLGIPHTTLDFSDEFRDTIVLPFADDYARGRTPSPCVRCNVLIKFGRLLERMLADGCDAVATGHYARTAVAAHGRVQLLRGRDPRKDQSYFLGGLRQDQLRHALFPLGGRLKEDVKAEALQRGLVREDKAESQDLCFLPDGEYARLVAAMRPELTREGPLVDTQGHVLGTHHGMFRYTIGQRRGIGLSGGPWYVVAIDADANTVTVGPRRRLGEHRVLVDNINWIIPVPEPRSTLQGTAKLRYNMHERQATARIHDDPTQMTLIFDDPVFAITPGQFAVLYQDERVLGGGWIQGAETQND